MFIVEEGNCILVHDKTGRLVYKSFQIVQYKKFNEASLVVITKESVDFVQETKHDNRYDITVVSDINFESALIHEDLIFIKRKALFNMLDVYNANFLNVLRLYKNIKDQWSYFLFKFKVPVKIITPLNLKGHLLYGSRNGKPCTVDLEKQKYVETKPPKSTGVDLASAINKFTVVGAK